VVVCDGTACPCSEAGILAAIAEGGGPFTFDCDGPTTVVTEAEIVIDNDVILDGEGNLTVEGNDGVFSVAVGVTAELRRVTATGAGDDEIEGGGDIIRNSGTLALTNSTVSGNSGVLISNVGTLTLTNSTLPIPSIGITQFGTLTLVNSTVSVIVNGSGPATIVNSTLLGGFINGSPKGPPGGHVTIMNSVVDNTNSGVGGCAFEPLISLGYNIESSGDTCGFDQPTDQVNVSADDLKLGPLQDNGGPTMTHALLPGSVAIDVIPEAECVDADGEPLTTDQRGEPRPGGAMCDVGSFEVQEGSL
jgi:hypothetical protein